MFFKYLLFHLGPKNANIMYVFGSPIALAYYEWRQRTREKLMNWHREQMRLLDPQFSLAQTKRELDQR